jgi:dihydrodipicolinate synthase/N-acetylneuraminate lyase
LNADRKDRCTGVVVPMITPLTDRLEIDTPAVGRVVDHLIAGGVGGIFPLGTTGESASISNKSRARLVEAVCTAVAGRATVYAGISSNVVSDSIEAAKVYQQAGVSFVVAHVPTYFALTDEQIYHYFARLADSVALPLVLYNIPVTTHQSISLDTVRRLASHGNVVAIKDSAGDCQRLTDLLAMTQSLNQFPVLLGSSGLFSHGLRAGAAGLVPSGAHLLPVEYQAMYDAARLGNWDRVDQLQITTDRAVSQYVASRTLGQSLAKLKSLLAEQGLCGPAVCPPLTMEPGA